MNQRYLLIPATIAFACALHATGTQAQTPLRRRSPARAPHARWTERRARRRA